MGNVNDGKLNHYYQMRYLQILFTIMLLIIAGCGKRNEKKTEIAQSERGCIVDVSDKIMSIKTDYVIGKVYDGLKKLDRILITLKFLSYEKVKKNIYS